MRYISTRGDGISVSGAEAIVKGLAPDGGLYVPEAFPTLNETQLKELFSCEYAELAAQILNLYLPELGLDKLREITAASASKFTDEAVTPLVKTEEDTYYLELWHGPTHAFKDVALTTLPYLMTASKELIGIDKTVMILVATSGDTGKAALEGFKDVPGTKIGVLYPRDGVSPMQKLQMTTQEGGNVAVWGIEGNFDDAQTAVKQIFTDPEIRTQTEAADIMLSSANSINLGRLLPQVVYYFASYADMVVSGELEYGDPLNFAVPTGNFGNILAAYYAKRMGLPIGKLICASNANNVLTDFLETGRYTTKRQFIKTISPSMDILISSNLERLLFELSGRDAARTKELMTALVNRKEYDVTTAELDALHALFYGSMADDDTTRETIANVLEEQDYIIDTHTAVAVSAAERYCAETGDETKTIIVSTASPYKFVDDVLTAIGERPEKTIEKSLEKLYECTALEIPETLSELPQKLVRFSQVLKREDISSAVMQFVREK